jgi:hypothetical protein
MSQGVNGDVGQALFHGQLDIHVARDLSITYHILTFRVVSPRLIVSNDTVKLLGSLVLGTWLIAIGLATASGSMVLFVTEVAISQSSTLVCSAGNFILWACTYSVIPQKPHLPQQTFRGHFWPGTAAFLPHSALAWQLDQQTSLGEIPDVPQALK